MVLAVEAAVESLRRYDTHSDSGDAVRDFLFTCDGEMTKLAAALSENDRPGLQRWADAHSDTNDSRWLTKTVKAANQPPIDDHRRRSFIEKHRAIRETLRTLNAAVAEDMKCQEGGIQLSPEQTTKIHTLTHLAVPESIPGCTPEQAATSLTIARLQARLTGDAGAACPAPTASLKSWALPQAQIILLSAAPEGALMAELLEAVCRDLAAGWSGPDAVHHLLTEGEYGLAADAIAQLRAEKRIDAVTEDSLRQELKAARTRLVDQLDARTRALYLRCEQIGLDGAETRWEDAGTLGNRRADAFARWRKIDDELMQEMKRLKKAVEERLTDCRAQLYSEWITHIEGLIEKEELAAAKLALTPSHFNSKHLLPQPVRLSLWSWRKNSVTEVATWLAPDGADVRPKGVREFTPDPSDPEAAAVVTALRGLADGSHRALADWLAAVQALVAETDVPPSVQPLDGGAAADFVLPYDVRLPRLRWVGRAPESVTVGAVSERSALHFSLETNDHRAGIAVVSVSDILSLLGRDAAGRPASRTTRALLFLSTMCSQLPLAQVIAARDTPAEHAVERRMALAWLLHILGFTVTATDLDRLRVLGGGHQVPLWHLIDAAREDPVDGISQLWERPDRDEILHTGLASDLDSEADLLVLSTLLTMDTEDRVSLATALELVWADAHASPEP